MWDVCLAFVIASAAAVESVGLTEPGHNTLGSIMAIVGLALGFATDLMLRHRAYKAMDPDERPTMQDEWRERLLWAVIGLGFGIVLAFMVNGLIDNRMQADARFIAPFINFCAVLNALLVIELIRGLGRLISGEGAQRAFAGLVIGWAKRKTGAKDD